MGGELLLGPAAVVARPRAVSRPHACDWPRCGCQWRVQAILGTAAPYSTIPFGGDQKFLPVFQNGCSQDYASFPCGHASMGFYLMAPAFFLYRRRPRLAAAFLCLGLIAGFTIGMARIVEGSHFASDVIWSGGFVYFTGLAYPSPFVLISSLPTAKCLSPLPSRYARFRRARRRLPLPALGVVGNLPLLQ